jgi:hypothetical protein
LSVSLCVFVRRFTVVMVCQWWVTPGTLDEDFSYSDGTKAAASGR